jgi:hypothetical protein
MRPHSPISYVPIETRLRNARPLITTVPPITMLAAALIAVSVWPAPSSTEVARAATAVTSVRVAPAMSEQATVEKRSYQDEADSTADLPRQVPIAR